jgi:hypothetical protein
MSALTNNPVSQFLKDANGLALMDSGKPWHCQPKGRSQSSPPILCRYPQPQPRATRELLQQYCSRRPRGCSLANGIRVSQDSLQTTPHPFPKVELDTALRQDKCMIQEVKSVRNRVLDLCGMRRGQGMRRVSQPLDFGFPSGGRPMSLPIQVRGK